MLYTNQVDEAYGVFEDGKIEEEASAVSQIRKAVEVPPQQSKVEQNKHVGMEYITMKTQL